MIDQREAKMAGLTGLFQRGSCYYLQVVLPLNHPLQKTYKNGKFVQSLGSCTYRDAIRDGTIKRAQVLYGAVQKPLPIDQSTFQTVAKPAVRHSLQDIHGKWKPSKARSDGRFHGGASTGRPPTHGRLTGVFELELRLVFLLFKLHECTHLA